MAESGRTTHDPGRSGRHGGHRERKGLGRDGITVMVNHDRALRAREISRPGEAVRDQAAGELPDLLARVRGRRGAAR